MMLGCSRRAILLASSISQLVHVIVMPEFRLMKRSGNSWMVFPICLWTELRFDGECSAMYERRLSWVPIFRMSLALTFANQVCTPFAFSSGEVRLRIKL